MVAERSGTILRPVQTERRAVARQIVNRRVAKLVWRVGPSRFSRTVGRLLDISEKGAGVVSKTIPAEETSLWFGLEELPWEWVKASVREVRPSGKAWWVHLEFAEPCPPGLLETVARPSLYELLLTWNPE